MPTKAIRCFVIRVPGRSRTCNFLVRSQVLYPLSYGHTSLERGDQSPTERGLWSRRSLSEVIPDTWSLRTNASHARFACGVQPSSVLKERGMTATAALVRPERLELSTTGSVDRCSIQLSYGRIVAWLRVFETTSREGPLAGSLSGEPTKAFTARGTDLNRLTNLVSPAGLEPAIATFGGWCLIHWATRTWCTFTAWQPKF